MSDIFLTLHKTNELTNMGGFGSGGARQGSGRKAIDGERVKFSVRIPERLLKQIKDKAEQSNLTASNIITELLEKGLEK